MSSIKKKDVLDRVVFKVIYVDGHAKSFESPSLVGFRPGGSAISATPGEVKNVALLTIDMDVIDSLLENLEQLKVEVATMKERDGSEVDGVTLMMNIPGMPPGVMPPGIQGGMPPGMGKGQR